MNKEIKCACGTAPKLIFSCSGASDVGELSDRTARKLTRDGKGKMYCLAGIGGRVSGMMATTEAAAKIFVMDGCPLECAKKTLEQAGFKNISHLRLSDIGFEKGKSTVNEKNIGTISSQCIKLLGADERVGK